MRGKKLYVLCPPEDYRLVAPAGRSADQGGTTKEGRFDPLDAIQLAERMAAGLRVYATVLGPGETIVAPDSWWHYAISLTPTITLMANFWDSRNLDGLRAMIRDGLSPSAPEQPLGPKGRGARRRVARGPAIVVRDGPSESAPVVGARRCGAEVLCLAERDGWVRVAGGGPDAEGWARADGIA